MSESHGYVQIGVYILGLIFAGFSSYLAVRVALVEQKAELKTLREVITLHKEEVGKLEKRFNDVERRCFAIHNEDWSKRSEIKGRDYEDER